eukprot:augustus_masked-scaffold_8-processed-gene-12.5-mRNA-1 protein AED:1.00 eAED:1.00 QI:0/-1/0/0/-1/1/1/0/1044
MFVFLWLIGYVSAQRVTEGVQVEYNFLLEKCINGQRSFPNTGNLQSLGNMIDLETDDGQDTFTCPGFEKDGLVFENAFNGLRTSGEAGSFGAASENYLNTTLLEIEFTMELWIFPEDGLGENKIVEISQAESEALWDGGTDEEFDFQIMLRDDSKIFVQLGFDPDSEDLYIFELEESIQPFSLYHLVFTYSFSEITFSVNSVQENHVLNNHLAFGENRFLTLGGGYEEVGRSFPGSIVYFSLYDFVLSSEQIQQNYEAGVPQRNGPVISDKTFFKKEDEELVIDLREAVFDLDDLRVEENEDELHFKILSSASRGQLFLDGELISSLEFPKTFEPDQVLSYKQTEENNFDAVDNLDIRISDTNSFSTASNKNAEITIRILEGNDKPKVESVNKGVALSRKIEFELVGSDVDSPFRDEESFIPTNFQITKISETSFGNFVDCETNELLELPQNFTANIKEEDSSEFFSIVCYRAKDGGESDESGVIGEDIFEVILIDGEGEKSEPRDISIQITLDIFVGCGDIGGTPCEELIQEGEELNFTLKAIDSLCDAGEQETNPVCEGAQKEIIIVQPLLNISQGYLSYYLDEEEIIISEDDFTNENNLFGYRLPKDVFELKYTPSEFYFNVAPAPLCGFEGTFRCAGSVDNSFSSTDEPDCVGHLCPSLTSHSLRNEVIGDCTSDSEFDGSCPVQIFYRLRTRNVISPEIHSLGQVIFVEHPINNFPPESLWLENNNQTLDIVDRIEETRILVNSIGFPFSITDNHKDIRNILLRISFEGDEPLGLTTFIGGDEVLFPDSTNLIFTDDDADELGLCLFTGCGPGRSMVLAAPVTTLNELLETLEIRVLNPDRSEQLEARLVFELGYVEPNLKTQQFTIPVKLRNLPRTSLVDLYLFLALLAFGCCSCYKLFGFTKKKLRNFLDGKRKVAYKKSFFSSFGGSVDSREVSLQSNASNSARKKSFQAQRRTPRRRRARQRRNVRRKNIEVGGISSSRLDIKNELACASKPDSRISLERSEVQSSVSYESGRIEQLLDEKLRRRSRSISSSKQR